MAFDKQQLIRLLRHLGYTQAADEAAQELPDQPSLEQVKKFGDRYGISRDELINRIGGSP